MSVEELFQLARVAFFTGMVVFLLTFAIIALLPKKYYAGDRSAIAVSISLAVGIMYASIYSELIS